MLEMEVVTELGMVWIVMGGGGGAVVTSVDRLTLVVVVASKGQVRGDNEGALAIEAFRDGRGMVVGSGTAVALSETRAGGGRRAVPEGVVPHRGSHRGRSRTIVEEEIREERVPRKKPSGGRNHRGRIRALGGP
jgi:hypothetical protein